MPEIRYVRAPGEDETVTAFGRTFEDGKFVEVSDKVAEKAEGNPSFEVKGKSAARREETRDREDGPEGEERRHRAAIQKAGQAETQKARQAEAKGSGNA